MKLLATLTVAALLAAPAVMADTKYGSEACVESKAKCMKLDVAEPLADWAWMYNIDRIIATNERLNLSPESDLPPNTWIYVG